MIATNPKQYPSTGDWYDVEAVWQKCIDFASNTCNTALMGIVPTVALARTGWDSRVSLPEVAGVA